MFIVRNVLSYLLLITYYLFLLSLYKVIYNLIYKSSYCGQSNSFHIFIFILCIISFSIRQENSLYKNKEYSLFIIYYVSGILYLIHSIHIPYSLYQKYHQCPLYLYKWCLLFWYLIWWWFVQCADYFSLYSFHDSGIILSTISTGNPHTISKSIVHTEKNNQSHKFNKIY